MKGLGQGTSGVLHALTVLVQFHGASRLEGLLSPRPGTPSWFDQAPCFLQSPALSSSPPDPSVPPSCCSLGSLSPSLGLFYSPLNPVFPGFATPSLVACLHPFLLEFIHSCSGHSCSTCSVLGAVCWEVSPADATLPPLLPQTLSFDIPGC